MFWYFFQFGLLLMGSFATGYAWGYFTHKYYIEDRESR